MFSWLKHHFVPHTGNNHRPHFLRNESMRGVAGFIIFIEVFAFIGLTFSMTGGFSWTASVLPAVLGELTNVERSNNHLAVLTSNPLLDQVATLKARDMAEKGYFAHTSPEGITPWFWFRQAGYDYEYAGENLAIDFTDSQDVTNAWMNSPTHRANIVKSAFTEIGTGVATGTYEGVATVFVAQVYAKPAVKIASSAKPVSTPKSEVVNDVKPIIVSTVKDLPQITETAPEPHVLGAVTTTAPEPTFWQRVALSPRHAANVIFAVIALWVLIALGIHIFIKKDSKHVDLVLNGLILIILIIAFFIANTVLAHRTQTSYQSFDASGQVTTSK